MVQPVQSAHIATLLLPLRDRPDGIDRAAASTFGAHSRGQVLFYFALQMILEFFVELLLHPLAGEERPEPEVKYRGEPHSVRPPAPRAKWRRTAVPTARPRVAGPCARHGSANN